MIGVIAAILLLMSIIFCIFSGNSAGVNDALFSGTADAIAFCLKTGGIICFFCGIMNIAKKAGIIQMISKILKPILIKIIPDCGQNSDTEDSVCMNVASNILGLGNAATPFGIKATDLLMGKKQYITRSTASFILLNTASVQILPTTIAAIRQSNGAISAFDILPATLIAQVTACTVGLLLIYLLYKKD